MSLVTTTEMLRRAQEGHYAVGAFNAENMEMLQAIVAAADELRAPVIVQTTPSTVRYASVELYCAAAAAVAHEVRVPVALHLDHSDSFSLAAKALRAGYTSMMIDGSRLPIDENIALTRSVVEMCRPSGVPVEGELGFCGEGAEEKGGGYTDPVQAIRFVNETGIFSLAVCVGTAHGFYTVPPVLNVGLISALRQSILVPMVLHGASGLSDDTVRDCVRRGICKVDFSTELRIAYTNAVKDFFQSHEETIDPKKFGEPARRAVKDLVKGRMLVCGCAGKV